MFWPFKKKNPKEKPDLCNSPAHLALLCQFTHITNSRELDAENNWKSVLGESPTQAIVRFTSEGLLREPTTGEYLESSATVAELKSYLKKQKLKVSGRKNELAERLVDAGFQLQEVSTKDGSFWVCTKQGQDIARKFIEQGKERENAAKAESIKFLKLGKINDAINEAEKYYTTAVSYNGRILGWLSDSREVAQKIKRIQNCRTPLILKGLNSETELIIREAICMSEIWGQGSLQSWLPAEFETRFRLAPDVIARMFHFSLIHKQKMSDAAMQGFKKLEIIGAEDYLSCSACKKLAGKKFRIKDVPELPLQDCQCEIGCRCEAIPVV